MSSSAATAAADASVPADHATGRPAASSTAPVRGNIRAVGWRRVSHGVFLPEIENADEDAELRRDLEAWLLVLPPGAVFTGLTAARLLGWQLPNLPEQMPVFAAVLGTGRRPRRSGLIASRLERAIPELKPPPVTDGELPTDIPEEVLLRAARDLGLIDLAILVDSAMRLGHLDQGRLSLVLGSRRPGVRNLRKACALGSEKSESGAETVLRLFHLTMQIPVEPQVDLFDDGGVFCGRADLLVTGTPFVHEYDGPDHLKKSQQRSDLRRGRGLGDGGFTRRGFTMDDLVNRHLVVMHELDRALDRRHDLARTRRWRALLNDSLYERAGRDRVLNRWRRSMGTSAWPTRTPRAA